MAVGVIPEAQTVPLQRLEEEICELAGHFAAAECRWLGLLAEFERREGWFADGIRSCAHWVSWRCGLSLGVAHEKLRVARRLEELPAVRAAFSRGELSYSKVRAITRVAGADNEESLLELARYATTAQLEKIVRAYRTATGADETRRANERHAQRRLRWRWEEDGSFSLSARLSPEDGAVVVAALEAAAAAKRDTGPEFSAENTGAAERADNRWADALVGVCRSALATADMSAGIPDRQLVVVHADLDVLTGERDEGRCHLEAGPGLAPETARRLGCDATRLTMAHRPDGSPLDIGRRHRAIPKRLRRALWERDRGCRFPGCTNRRYVDGHHVRHWSRGGETSMANLVLACDAHHRLVHEGGYGITADGTGGFVFTRPNGEPIPEHPAGPQPSGADLPTRNHTQGLTIDPLTPSSLGEGERYDLGLTIDALLGRRTPVPVSAGGTGS